MRETYTRNELVQVLRAVTQFLQGLPESMTLGGDEAGNHAAHGGVMLRDGMVMPATLPGDARVVSVTSKGQPQPARKQYIPAPKVKRERVDWGGVPRAARRIGDLVLEHQQPLTSHEIMSRLDIARPTFNNAVSVLLRRKIIATQPARAEHH